MARRYIFKKWDNTPETTKCELCPNQTLYFITDNKTGEETWCCLECALKHYKIKRLKNLLKKYPIRKKKTILAQNSLIKNSQNVNLDTLSKPTIVCESQEAKPGSNTHIEKSEGEL